jgi:hypothetical protein
MPGYKGHLLGGIIIYAIALTLLQDYCASIMVAGQWLLCTICGALFPDIDVKSKGQKYFYWFVLAGFFYLIVREHYGMLAFCSILSVVPMLSRHRGLFHELWFLISLPVIAWFLVAYYWPGYMNTAFFYALFFLIGALSHLFLDRGWRRMLS